MNILYGNSMQLLQKLQTILGVFCCILHIVNLYIFHNFICMLILCAFYFCGSSIINSSLIAVDQTPRVKISSHFNFSAIVQM